MEGGVRAQGTFTALFEIELLKAMLNEVSSIVTTNRGEGHRVSSVGNLKSHFFRLWSKCPGGAAYRHVNKMVASTRLNSSLQLHFGHAWGRQVV